MSGGGQHIVQRRKPLCHKQGDLLEGLSLDHQLQVVPAAHQQHALHLVKGGDGGGDLVKAAALFGADVQLDDRLHAVHLGLFPVHKGLIALDDALRPGKIHHRSHLGGGFVQHGGNVLHGQPGVVFQNLQKLFHCHILLINPLHGNPQEIMYKYSTSPGRLHLIFI